MITDFLWGATPELAEEQGIVDGPISLTYVEVQEDPTLNVTAPVLPLDYDPFVGVM